MGEFKRRGEERREETKKVKKALADAGFKASVGHGRGTARSWLEINLGPKATRDQCREAERVAQEVTGRHGEYGGNILVLSQSGPGFQEEQP